MVSAFSRKEQGGKGTSLNTTKEEKFQRATVVGDEVRQASEGRKKYRSSTLPL